MRNLAEVLEIFEDLVSTGEFEDVIGFAEERFPEAIKRAIEAEAEVERLKQKLAKVAVGLAYLRETIALEDPSHAGTAMLERMKKLEAVVAALKKVLELEALNLQSRMSKEIEPKPLWVARQIELEDARRKVDETLAALDGGQE